MTQHLKIYSVLVKQCLYKKKGKIKQEHRERPSRADNIEIKRIVIKCLLNLKKVGSSLVRKTFPLLTVNTEIRKRKFSQSSTIIILIKQR